MIQQDQTREVRARGGSFTVPISCSSSDHTLDELVKSGSNFPEVGPSLEQLFVEVLRRGFDEQFGARIEGDSVTIKYSSGGERVYCTVDAVLMGPMSSKMPCRLEILGERDNPKVKIYGLDPIRDVALGEEVSVKTPADLVESVKKATSNVGEVLASDY